MYVLFMWVAYSLAALFAILTFIDWLRDEKIRLSNGKRLWFLTAALFFAALANLLLREVTGDALAGGVAAFLGVLAALVLAFRFWTSTRRRK